MKGPVTVTTNRSAADAAKIVINSPNAIGMEFIVAPRVAAVGLPHSTAKNFEQFADLMAVIRNKFLLNRSVVYTALEIVT